MPHDLPPIPPEQLYLRRLAWRALELVLDQYGLAAVTLKLNPDDPHEALPGHLENEVLFGEDLLRRWEWTVARVQVDGTRARVIIDRVDRLVRANHRKDFRAEEVGIISRRGQSEIDTEVDLADVVEQWGELFRTSPQRVQPRVGRRGATPDAIRAFGSGRE